MVEVILEAVEFVIDQLESFNAAGGTFVLSQRDVPFDAASRILERFAKQRHVLASTFQVVKRGV